MSIENANAIFERARKTNFSSDKGAIPSLESRKVAIPTTDPESNYLPGISKPRTAPVTKRVANLDATRLPKIEEATTFEEQSALLALHLKANQHDGIKVRTLVSEWMDVIMDESSSMNTEFRESMSELSKQELVNIIEKILANFY